MKKEDFLNKLRKNTHVQFDMPAVDVKGIQYEDTLKQFIEMTESVGGHVIEAKEGESLDELVKKAYPEAKGFVSHLPEITIAQKNPDTVPASAPPRCAMCPPALSEVMNSKSSTTMKNFR